jgi:DNA-binding NtrC family response regulator
VQVEYRCDRDQVANKQDIVAERAVLAATNVDLRAALENGTFRENLYYCLNVMPNNILRYR